MNASEIADWLQQTHFCISPLYLLPGVLVVLLLLVCYGIYCHLCVRELRRRLQAERAAAAARPPPDGQGCVRVSRMDSFRRKHQSRQSQLF